jgi:thiamine-monophosphate kinase
LEEGRYLLEQFSPHAMMDISDGLATDLPRILQASRLSVDVNLEDLPLAPPLSSRPKDWEIAISEGEDYELLVAMAPRTARKAMQDPKLRRVGFTQIGTFQEGSALNWLHRGKKIKLTAKGWQHRWAGEPSTEN